MTNILAHEWGDGVTCTIKLLAIAGINILGKNRISALKNGILEYPNTRHLVALLTSDFHMLVSFLSITL